MEGEGAAKIDQNETLRLRIQNVVTTADVKQPVDATRFNSYPWGRYDIENNYNGKVGYIKDDNMPGRVTVFISGKMISTGARSVSQSINQLKHTMSLLTTSNFIKRGKLESKVRNIVATVDFKHTFDICDLSQRLPKILYEPWDCIDTIR